MGDWLHIPTKQYLTSASPNSLPHPISEYIPEPDLSAVEGQPTKYWDISGDTVTLKSKSERDGIDAIEKDARDTAAIYAQMTEVNQVLLEKINAVAAGETRNTTLAEVTTEAKAKLP